MNQLERKFGNSLEIEEARDALNGKMEVDVKEVVLELVSYILKLAGKGDDLEENKRKALENVENGKAYAKFLQLIEKQGGDINYLSNIPKAKYIKEIIADEAGYVSSLNAEICGKVSLDLGARKGKKGR